MGPHVCPGAYGAQKSMLNVFLSHSVPSSNQSLTDLIGLAGPQAPWVLIAASQMWGYKPAANPDYFEY